MELNLIRGFMELEIKDPIGVIVKKFTVTGNLTRIFKIGENVIGTFVINRDIASRY